jgi:hypothetical protein
MSLYHQQTMPGPSSYAAPSFAHRAAAPSAPYQHNPYPAPAPAPPRPIYHMDPTNFRRDLEARLELLTDNNRDIIGSILTFVQQYPRWSEIVGQCLESHIRRVSSFPFRERRYPPSCQADAPIIIVSISGSLVVWLCSLVVHVHGPGLRTKR